MATVSANWAEVLEPILRTIFEKHIAKKKDYLPTIYNVEDSTKSQETNLGVGSLGIMDEWRGSVAYEDVNKGYTATYVHKKYSKGLQIERDLVEDDKNSVIKRRVTGLAQSVWYTKQVHAALPFNNATTMLGPDGVPLLSTIHPLAPGSGSTWSNYDNNLDLTDTNVETVRNRMKAWTDDKGNLLAINPDTLIVPSAKRKTAMVIADSDQVAGSANNDTNVYKGALDVIEWDFLTNSKMWFLVDMERMKQFLNFYIRREPKLESDGYNFDTEVGKWRTIGRWSFGFDDASFVYGCQASS